MERREFITLLGGAAAAWPLAAWAQQPEKMRRIGVLVPQDQDSPVAQARIEALLQELRQLGWTGRNVRIDIHWAGADAENIRKHAAELATLAPDSHPREWQRGRSGIATGDPHRAHRVCDSPRPCWRRVR